MAGIIRDCFVLEMVLTSGNFVQYPDKYIKNKKNEYSTKPNLDITHPGQNLPILKVKKIHN